MKISIQKWGNSAGIRLPALMLAQMGLKIEDTLDANVSGDVLTLRAAKPRYVLSDLLAQCDAKADAPADLDAWNNMVPVGQEVV